MTTSATLVIVVRFSHDWYLIALVICFLMLPPKFFLIFFISSYKEVGIFFLQFLPLRIGVFLGFYWYYGTTLGFFFSSVGKRVGN